MGPRVLPVLPQAAPAQQHKPHRYPQPREVRMCEGKRTGDLRTVGGMGKAGLRDMGYHGSPHSSEAMVCMRATSPVNPGNTGDATGSAGSVWCKMQQGLLFAHDIVTRCEILLDQHSLEPEIWQAGIVQTSHTSPHPESLSDMPDLAVSA